MILADIAHARAGDKGRVVTIVVMPHRPEGYAGVVCALTTARIAEQLGWLFPSGFDLRAIAGLGAVLIVGRRARDDDVTVSLAADRHGKSAAGILLALTIDAKP